MTDKSATPLTMFMCGPIKCDHKWDILREIVENGKVIGMTSVCANCGRTAYEEAAWE